MPKKNTEEDSCSKWTGRVTGGAVSGGYRQTRFQRIPDAHLNNETVAGIRDMNLGRVMKNGKPTGAPTIRFDTGRTSGTRPHINIDPAGRPSPSNPHVNVSEGTVNAAATINKTLKYVGVTLTVAAVAIDTWRIISAFQDDLEIRNNADEIIEELEDAIEKLKKQLKAEIGYKRRDIRYAIEHLEEVLKDVRRTKKVPVKFIKTTSSAAGGWTGGAAGGAGGAWAGAQAGAAIGLCFGPAGAAVGAPVGAIFGAISGGIAGGIAGSYTGEVVADKTLETLVD